MTGKTLDSERHERMDANTRHGILAGGNFIVDHVKQIDHYPEQDQLTLVRSETLSNGGGPYNLLKDLAAMNVGIPLQAVGLIGDDVNGQWIIDDCQSCQIDTGHLHQTSRACTAWTDVMSVTSTGRRTFFHHAGTNALLSDEQFDFEATTSRVFYLGYLTLLEQLDRIDGNGQSGASRVFKEARAAGMITVADTVSGNHPRFREIVTSAAPQLDYLLLNELEAGWLVGRTLKCDATRPEALQAAASEVIQLGVAQAVAIHFEHGAVVAQQDGRCYVQGAVQLPQDEVRGTVGAGDAFAAGYLHGIHQRRCQQECLFAAVCCAAACLTEPTTSGGVRPIDECLDLARQHGCRRFS
jgi:sugar/nucleoside kinase (ribokinase family)